MNELEEKMKSLKTEYDRLETAHGRKCASRYPNETAYHDACRKMNAVYDEMRQVGEQLGKPLPRMI